MRPISRNHSVVSRKNISRNHTDHFATVSRNHCGQMITARRRGGKTLRLSWQVNAGTGKMKWNTKIVSRRPRRRQNEA